jgi:hypothetical protein
LNSFDTPAGISDNARSLCVIKNGSLAQLVEQRTLNPFVEGSNPSRPTNIIEARSKAGLSCLFGHSQSSWKSIEPARLLDGRVQGMRNDSLSCMQSAQTGIHATVIQHALVLRSMGYTSA